MKPQHSEPDWPDPCRRGLRGRRRLLSFAAIVRDYVRRHRPKTARELGYFRGLSTLEEALTRAGLAQRPDGKRWSHQRRIPRAVLEQATRRLRQAELKRARSFADLIARVHAAVQSVPGIGELYVYDTALRLGAHLRLLPRDVYLHAGTRRGARALGLDYRARSLAPTKLPTALQCLRPHELEDVLCIYKEWLTMAKGA
jgi:hypothetical protein